MLRPAALIAVLATPAFAEADPESAVDAASLREPAPRPPARPQPSYVPALTATGGGATDAPHDPAIVVIGDYKLARTAAGRYVYQDSRFKVQIDTDGATRFTDKEVETKTGIERMLDPKELAGWRDRDTRPRISARRPDATVHAPTERDDPFYRQRGLMRGAGGSVVPATGLASLLALVPWLTGTSGVADASDMLERARGRDPYAYDKARFLEATFALRTRLAAGARKQDLLKALRDLPRFLDLVWGDHRFTRAERLRILELLRDECDVSLPGGPEAHATIDHYRTRAAATAD